MTLYHSRAIQLEVNKATQALSDLSNLERDIRQMTCYLSQAEPPLEMLQMEKSSFYCDITEPPFSISDVGTSEGGASPKRSGGRPKGMGDSHPLMRKIVITINRVLVWHAAYELTWEDLYSQHQRLQAILNGTSRRQRKQSTLAWLWESLKRLWDGNVVVEDGADLALLRKWQLEVDHWWMLTDAAQEGKVIREELEEVCGELRAYLQGEWKEPGSEVSGSTGVGGTGMVRRRSDAY